MAGSSVIATAHSGGVGTSVLAMTLAGLAVLWRTSGRESLRRLWDRRRHPARIARVVVASAAAVGAAGATAIVARESAARPDPPQGSAVIVSSGLGGPRPATFILVNDVPGDEQDPAPLTSSGASF